MAMTMKFRAHETFFIRKGWLSKGMKSVNAKGCIPVRREITPSHIFVIIIGAVSGGHGSRFDRMFSKNVLVGQYIVKHPAVSVLVRYVAIRLRKEILIR